MPWATGGLDARVARRDGQARRGGQAMTVENLHRLKHKLGSILKYNIEGIKRPSPMKVRPFFFLSGSYGLMGVKGDYLEGIYGRLILRTHTKALLLTNNLPTKHPKTTKNSGYGFNIMGTSSLWTQCAPNTV
jgi:hypothetical protein